ncbi:MAG: hypothetical protein WCB71_07755, partial [Aestuariivirga sp.]
SACCISAAPMSVSVPLLDTMSDVSILANTRFKQGGFPGHRGFKEIASATSISPIDHRIERD